MKTLAHRRDIDGLRSLAVLPVVLGHAGFAGFSGGFVGVDIFFVISGYLITGILLRELEAGRFSLVTFYERRARRILPALFALLAICLAAGWFTLLPEAFASLGKSIFATLLFVSNIWFWNGTGNYFGPEAELEPLLHTWSLAVEEQFYIFFPLLLWVLARRGKGWILPGILITCLLSFALSLWATGARPFANFFLAPTRIWELGIGALLAAGALPACRNGAVAQAAALSGIVAIIGSIALLTPDSAFPGLSAAPACLGTAAVIWSGTQYHGTVVSRILSLPALVWIGLISYSLYLWHWPILVATRLYHGTLHLPTGAAVLAIALAIGLAHLSWRYVERPFRKSGPVSFSRPAIFRLSGAGGAVIAGLAGLVILMGGFPARIPAPVMQAYEEAIRPSPLRARCMGRSAQEGFCRLGADATATPDVLVWGDSHAGAMLPGVEAWLDTHNRTGLAAVKTACPPLLGLIRTTRSNHACDHFNAGVVEFLAAHEEIRTVILAGRWALAVEGTRPEGESGPKAVLALSKSVNMPELALADNVALAAFGFAATLGTLQDMGKEVLVIEGIPEIGFNVPKALMNAAFFSARLPEPPNQEAFTERNRRANAMIEETTERYGAHRVSAADLMCQSDCAIETGGKALYYDDDHLSVTGARTIVPQLLEAGLNPLNS